MLENINKTWSTNHGWLLSGASLIVGLVACLIWYLDWVPEINFVNFTTKPPLVSQSIQPQSGILVAQINASSERQGKKGRILLYSRNAEQTQPPQYQEKFVLDERGASAILLIVPTAEYMAIAFIDENDNGQLDFEDEQAVEPFSFPRTALSGADTENLLSVEGGLVSLQAQIPILVTFDFAVPTVGR